MTTYVAFVLLVMFAATGIGAAHRYAREPRSFGIGGAAVLALVAVGMWALQTQPETLFSDFKKAYYTAGEIIRDDAGLLYGDEPLLFVNIPIVAWLFAPFSYLSADHAGWAMMAIGLVAIAAAYLLFVRMGELDAWQAAVLAGAFAICGPLYYSVREGNTTHILLFVLAGMLWCASRRRYGWAGVLLAAATIIKPPLGLIVLPFLLRERWSFVGTFAATGLLVGGLSLALYGVDLHQDWYDYAVRPYSEHPLGAENVQSLDGVLARLYTADYIDDFTPIEELDSGFRLIRTALAGLLFVVAAGVLWRGRKEGGPQAEWTDAGIALCLALLIAPTSWTHYYLLLLLPLALCIAGGLRVPFTPVRAGLVALAALMISPPVIFIAPDAPVLEWLVPRVLISHYFYGGLLLLGILLEARWRAGSEDATRTTVAAA